MLIEFSKEEMSHWIWMNPNHVHEEEKERVDPFSSATRVYTDMWK